MEMSPQPAFWSVWLPWTDSRQIVQILSAVTKVTFRVRRVEETCNIPVANIGTFISEQCKYVQQLHRHGVFSGKAPNGYEPNLTNKPC